MDATVLGGTCAASKKGTAYPVKPLTLPKDQGRQGGRALLGPTQHPRLMLQERCHCSQKCEISGKVR